jgi:hypothetical protein
LNGGPLAGRGIYEARIACNLRSGNGVFAYAMVKPENTGHPYFTQDGTDREDNPGQYIANMRDGSMAGFKYFDMDGAEEISVTIRGIADGFLVLSAETDPSPAARIPITSCGKWHELSAFLPPLYGKHALYFTYQGSGSLDFKSFRLV